jgi:hypothetical protein
MEDLIQQALDYAEKKFQSGLLVWDEIPELEDKDMRDWWSTPNGDRETLYSIASLYSQFPPNDKTTDECREILEDILCKRYPNFW